jgi:hypothetical protein
MISFGRRVVFLVADHRDGATYLVFTGEDPRQAGYEGVVDVGVTLDYDMEAVHRWPDGEAAPEACVGRDPTNPTHYKVFKFSRDRQAEGFQPVAGTPLVFVSWRDYARLRLPPDPEKTEDESWYDYLDRLDEAARRRRQRAQRPPAPMTGSRDEVAAWVAKRHLIADSGIREVWYLPGGAPPEEIRLLELNDLLAGPEAKAEAIDFGLDVEGKRYRLVIADVTTEQLEHIKQDRSRLPSGWSLDNPQIWRRRGA